MKTRKNFTRRPDAISEELIAALLAKPTHEYSELFLDVQQRLQSRKIGRPGEEMLRLRVYEKLQNLVAKGFVGRKGKVYLPMRMALIARAAEMADERAKDEQRRGAMLHVE